MLKEEYLINEQYIDESKKIVYDALVEVYKIASVSDKIIFLCKQLKKVTQSSDVFLVNYESNNFSFFEVKSYNRILQFYNSWSSTLKLNKTVIIGKENVKFLSDYIFLKRNLLEYFIAIPIFVQANFIGFIALENSKNDFKFVNDAVNIFASMINEHFEKLYESNISNYNLKIVPKGQSNVAKFQLLFNNYLTLLWADDSFYKIIGHTKIDFFKLTRGNTAEFFKRIKPNAFNGQAIMHHFVEHIIQKDGSINYLYIKVYLTNEFKKKIRIAECTCYDITYIKNSSDALIAKMKVSNSIIADVKIGHFIFEYKRGISILTHDSDALDILKIDHDFITNNNDLFTLMEKNDREIFKEAIKKSSLENNFVEFTIKLSKKDVSIYCIVTKVIGEDDFTFHATISDISHVDFGYNDFTPYKNMPGFIAKFMVNDKLRLLEANDGFFEFLGLDINRVNCYMFPPVLKKDVRIVNNNINKMRTGKPISFDFRAKNKDGKVCWLHLEANCIGLIDINPVYLAIFIDITKQRQLELELEEKRIKYDLMDIEEKESFFEYDIINDIFNGPTYFMFEKTLDVNYGYVENYLEKLTMLIPRPNKYIKKWINLLCGVNYDPFEMKFSYEIGDHYITVDYVIEANVVYDGRNPIKVLGKVIDKNKDIEKEEELININKYDNLTNLFSRTYGEGLIKEYLEENHVKSHLLVIDIDDFKRINQTYGYMFGNVILNEFGELLHRTFPSNSIIYRLLDDDFVVFLRDSSIEMAKHYADQVCESISEIYIGDDESSKLSCSVGISSIKYESDFETSLRQASDMVFQIKNCGQGFSAYFPKEYEEKEVLNEISRGHISDVPFTYLKRDKDIIFFAYEILEKTKNFRNALNILLSRAGKEFKLCSISIISTIVKDNKYDIKYWWEDNNQYGNVLDFLGSIEKQLFEVFTNINTKSIEDFKNCICIGNKNHINNILVCGERNIASNNEVIILEPAEKTTIWTNSEKELIFELSKIILAHIKKARAYSISEEKNKFLSKMSHEIRTPLNIIIGMANLTMNIKNHNATISRYLKTIDISAKYLLSLVNNLLEMSRIESGKMKLAEEVFNLSEYAENLNSMMSVQAKEKNIEFKIEKDIKHNIFIGDSVRLNQVLINLISNAIKFTPEYGKVTLTIKQVDEKDNLAFINFSIKDTGVGIKKDRIKKVFEPFEQEDKNTSNRYGGTGLGLSISNNLVYMMGGVINVKSEENKGSEFEFTIPIRTNCDVAKNNLINFNSLCNKRILVGEDNNLNAEIVKTLLENVGAKVEVACDGNEVIKSFTNHNKNYYDIILMDVRMPNKDGLVATSEIRKINRNDASSIPIIAMTANAFEEDINECYNAGMNGYIAKPIDIEKLYTQLNKVLST